MLYGDSGTPINPQLLEGQLIGAFNRGLGYALVEDLKMDQRDGQVACHGLMVDYKTMTSYEMPTLENTMVRLCDIYEPSGPFGAKGCGEAALASVASSISNAIYNAIGIRFHEIPITPEKVLKALEEQAKNA